MKIFYKIILGYTILIIFLGSFFIASTIFNVKQNAKKIDSYREREVSTMVHVLDAIILDEKSLTREYAQKIIDETIKELPHIKRFSIHAKAPEGKSPSGYWYLASSAPERIGKPSDPEDVEAIKKEIDKILYEVDKNGDRFIDITHHLHDMSGKAIATAGVTISLKEQDEILKEANEKMINNSITYSIIILSIALIVSIIISLIISNAIYSPIKKLINSVVEISKGNLSEKIDLKSNDEIGELALSFNNMARELKGVYENLENKINEKTKSLEVINRELKNEIEKKEIAQNKILELNKTLKHKVKDEMEKQRKQEQLLIQQSKMASMGEMIGNIAHQWRQPLNALGLILQKLKLAQKKGKLNDEMIEASSQKGMLLINKMSTTIDDFRNFFKPNKLKIDFDIRVSILDTIELIEAGFKYHNIELILDLEDNIIMNGYPNEFSQVILNILNNSKDILIEREVKNPKIQIKAIRDENVKVFISDNGGGISDDIIDKIFEPYFTTKDEGRGTGIGLYMSKQIIEHNMHGKLSVKNIKEGAQFLIKL